MDLYLEVFYGHVLGLQYLAVLTKELGEVGQHSSFVGLDASVNDELDYLEIKFLYLSLEKTKETR